MGAGVKQSLITQTPNCKMHSETRKSAFLTLSKYVTTCIVRIWGGKGGGQKSFGRRKEGVQKSVKQF